MAGRCVHVCAVIYVLSIIKNDLNLNPENIKYPASHLNDILVNTEKSEKTLSGIAGFETSVLSSVELFSENEESISSTFLSTIE